MISALFAALLLTAAAQDPNADPAPQPATYQDDYVNGQEDTETPEADPYAEPEPVVEEAPIVQAAADEPEEEDVPMVCRRVHYQDDYGRTRSRRSCTPR